MPPIPKPRARKPAARKRKPAAPKRVAAARAETKPETTTVNYRGLELAVPPASEWGSELFFLVGDMQEQGDTVALVVRVIVELLGEEQYTLVRAKLRDDKVPFTGVLPALHELFNTVFAEYGTSLGEFNASPGT